MSKDFYHSLLSAVREDDLVAPIIEALKQMDKGGILAFRRKADWHTTLTTDSVDADPEH
ncbi:uncharacterized protein PV07_12440 [Cladophialophora immunda]|uniref:Uncharacterized protein n=1 Tax=Cladophialophora immunda TaxID=569365 RepID=A0A0D2CEZ0_9EURO|nr:uncharacterized protein PV07_12440 [Cladophialophora immunda]KIW22119.1 hypothetical protein PV07_12440 [Cladophialophora immunda]